MFIKQGTLKYNLVRRWGVGGGAWKVETCLGTGFSEPVQLNIIDKNIVFSRCLYYFDKYFRAPATWQTFFQMLEIHK